VQDVVGEQKITIFPNPTKGKLGIQFHQSGVFKTSWFSEPIH
jgi:hypothetical protein